MYFDMHCEVLKSRISSSRKTIRMNICLVIFNISVLVIDAFNGSHSNSRLCWIAFGCMLINLLWSILFLLESMAEQKNDKEILRWISQRKEAIAKS